MIRFTKSMICAAAVCLGLAAASGTANAGDCYRPQYVWKTVVSYQTVEVPVTKWITKYDHCGRAYRQQITVIQTVEVPVERRVKVYL